jgi:hypothetical protein
MSVIVPTKKSQVTLNELIPDEDRYFHMCSDTVESNLLSDLIDEYSEGRRYRCSTEVDEDQQDESQNGIGIKAMKPITIHRDEKGQPHLVNGHREVAACRFLASEHVPGFREDMKLDAVELVNASPQALIIASTVGIHGYHDLGQPEGIRACKRLVDALIPAEKVAKQLGVDVGLVGRIRLIGQHEWMYPHVLDESIAIGQAAFLLGVAQECDCLKELREYLDDWIHDKKKSIREEEKRCREVGRDLPEAKRAIKNQLSDDLVVHWGWQLFNRNVLDDNPRWKTSPSCVDRKTANAAASRKSLEKLISRWVCDRAFADLAPSKDDSDRGALSMPRRASRFDQEA